MSSSPSGQKSSTAGAAGDNGAQEEWYAEYMGNDDGRSIRSSLAGELDDLSLMEPQILELASQIEPFDEFCAVCRSMFDDWPFLDPSLRPNWNPEKRTEQDTSGTKVTPDPGEKSWIDPFWGLAVALPCRTDTVELEAATRKGCLSCAFILQCIVENELLATFKTIERRLKSLSKPSNLSLAVVKWGVGGQQILRLSFPGKQVGGVNDESQVIKFYSHPHKSSGSQENFPGEFPMRKDTSLSLIARWTSDCLESHEACNLEHPADYPTRLLSVATDPIRLVATASLEGRPRYATLSHRWGNRKTLCLTPDNMSMLTTGIPQELLSQTCKDAVTIARAAGLDYLWVDGLCIIQGDVEDWGCEANKMSSVYGGSSLTISASSAETESDGCFMMPEYFSGGFRTEISINGSKETHDFTRETVYDRSVTDSYLASRGWAVQEKILSPRTVHCGKEGLLWECRTKVASESFPDGFRGHFHGHTLVAPSPWAKRKLTLKERWPDIRFWYSSGDLTVSSDKLVAIAGVARAVHEESGDQYYAGLWQTEIEDELCWVAMKPQRRPAYRAPSWSWAAVDGRVRQNHINSGVLDTLLAHVQSISVAAEPDQFGAVSGGSVSLGCSGMLSGRVVATETARRAPDNSLFDRSAAYIAAETFVDLGHQKQDFAFHLDCAEEKDARVSTRVYFLPIQGGDARRATRGSDGAWIRHKTIVGLVLCETGLQKGQYTRIGSFCLDYTGDESVDYHPFMELLETSGPQVAEEGCAEVIENKEHPSERFLLHII